VRKVKVLKFIFPLLAIGLFVLPSISLAVLPNAPQEIEADPGIAAPTTMNQLSGANLNSVTRTIVNLRNWFAGIVMVVAVAALLFGAIKYMFSGGDATKTKDARGWIVGGVIGAIIAAVSFGLVSIVMNIMKNLSGLG
jgi:hypothetical protein